MILIIFNILMAISTYQDEGIKIEADSYNLNGNVRVVQEMKAPAVFESGLWKVDSSENRLIRKSVKNFDQEGLLERIQYYRGVYEITFTSIMRVSGQGFFQGSDEYDAQNILQSKTKILSVAEEKLETLTVHATTKEKLSKSENVYVNGLLERQIRTYYGRDAYLFYRYKRDFRGNEIEIEEESRYDGEVFSQVYSLEYLEFDEQGNWTKRKECDAQSATNCTLTIRSIVYYK